MTDTQPLAPTDAEIDALELLREIHSDLIQGAIPNHDDPWWQKARAVLARWGQPAHSGEPCSDSLRHQNKLLAESLGACILASGIVRKDIDGFTCPQLLHFAEDLQSMLEKAPQPVEREPLPDSWILSMCAQPWIFNNVKQWVRIIEAAHGIKGGEHG